MAVSITDLTRRRFFGFTAVVMASTAVPALMWQTWNKERIITALIAHSDAYHEDSWTDRYSAEETEAYKKSGGWPEYS